MWCSGSSPLARGLRRAAVHVRPASRIIPARAGFTASTPPHTSCATDHPRSRGVYFTCLRFGQMPPGSSPLARGLRQSVTVSKRGDGIIPARAGFTRLDASSTSHEPDHPRSRGVYRDCPCPLPFPCGSSPLARGLRGNVEICHDRFRIIPARAGFTSVPAACPTATWDHPRSRGVYRTTRFPPSD